MGPKAFKELLELLFENGVIAIPLITFFSMLVVIGIISSKDKLYQLLGKEVSIKTVATDINDLKYHSLFLREPKYKMLAQNSSFGSEIKDKIFRFILLSRLRSTIDCTKSMLDEQPLVDFPVKKLQYWLQENTRLIVETYNKKIKNFLISEHGDSAGNKLYEYIMNSAPAGFNTIYDSQILHIDQLVEYLCRTESSIFKNNVDRIEVYLYMLNSLLHVGVADSENVFRAFNGKLEKIIKEYGG